MLLFYHRWMSPSICTLCRLRRTRHSSKTRRTDCPRRVQFPRTYVLGSRTS